MAQNPDHELLIGTTTERLRLIRDENGQVDYSVENFVPEYRNPLTFTQSDWVGGHGQHSMQIPDIYFEGQSIDTTQDGRVFLGPEITTLDGEKLYESYTTAVDGAASVNGGTYIAQTFTPTITHTISHAYLYLYRFGSPATVDVSITATSGGTPSGAGLISGTIAGNSLGTGAYGDKTKVVFTSTTTLGSGTQYAVVAKATAGDGSNLAGWARNAAGSLSGGTGLRSLDSGATWSIFAGVGQIQFFEEYTSNGTALDSAPVDFCWFPAISKWIMATSGKVYLYQNEGWIPSNTTLPNVTDLCVFGSYLFAARGTGTAYAYSSDGDTWTESTLTDGSASYFLTAPNSAATADVLWKAKTPNELKSNTSGINGGADWSSTAYIGDTSCNITNLFLVNDNLMIGKTNNLWYYDTDGGTHPLRSDLEKHISTDNFKYIAHWSGATYFSEINGMGEITSQDAYSPMGPLHDIENTGKRGDVVGLASDKDFIYVAVDEGTNTIIYKGREKWRNNTGLRWEWCPWIFLGTNTCATIATCAHTTTDRRLWFGNTSGSSYQTGYVKLSDNPTADTNARFTTSGWLRMSYDYGSDPRWDKLWQSAVFEVVGGASGETVGLSYRKDTDTGTTSIITGASTNGVYETNFGSSLSCKRAQFQIDLASNTNTATPEVSYFQAKGLEKPTVVRIHNAVYDIGDEPSNRAKTLRDLLRTAQSSTTLIKFADLRYKETTGGSAGVDYVYCVLEPGYPQEIEVRNRGKDARPEQAIKVRLREVSFT